MAAASLDQDEFVRTVAELVAGLGVPMSQYMPLGSAREPWAKLYHLGGPGWQDADRLEQVLREGLGLSALDYRIVGKD
jgi:hypothetical protein